MEPDPTPEREHMTGECSPVGSGNEGRVVRVGETVRRPVGPWTPAVHLLLAHLRGPASRARRP